MNSNNFKNVHIYDGKLTSLYTPQNNGSKSMTNSIKKDFLLNFIEDIFNSYKKNISKPINLFIKGLEDNNNSNFDKSNNIDSCDLLIDTLIVLDKKELLKPGEGLLEVLIEQLNDFVNLGQCPQGRSTRLLQIWQLIN